MAIFHGKLFVGSVIDSTASAAPVVPTHVRYIFSLQCRLTIVSCYFVDTVGPSVNDADFGDRHEFPLIISELAHDVIAILLLMSDVSSPCWVTSSAAKVTPTLLSEVVG